MSRRRRRGSTFLGELLLTCGAVRILQSRTDGCLVDGEDVRDLRDIHPLESGGTRGHPRPYLTQ
jgi:hypothetical protein